MLHTTKLPTTTPTLKKTKAQLMGTRHDAENQTLVNLATQQFVEVGATPYSNNTKQAPNAAFRQLCRDVAGKTLLNGKPYLGLTHESFLRLTKALNSVDSDVVAEAQAFIVKRVKKLLDIGTLSAHQFITAHNQGPLSLIPNVLMHRTGVDDDRQLHVAFWPTNRPYQIYDHADNVGIDLTTCLNDSYLIIQEPGQLPQLHHKTYRGSIEKIEVATVPGLIEALKNPGKNADGVDPITLALDEYRNNLGQRNNYVAKNVYDKRTDSTTRQIFSICEHTRLPVIDDRQESKDKRIIVGVVGPAKSIWALQPQNDKPAFELVRTETSDPIIIDSLNGLVHTDEKRQMLLTQQKADEDFIESYNKYTLENADCDRADAIEQAAKACHARADDRVYKQRIKYLKDYCSFKKDTRQLALSKNPQILSLQKVNWRLTQASHNNAGFDDWKKGRLAFKNGKSLADYKGENKDALNPLTPQQRRTKYRAFYQLEINQFFQGHEELLELFDKNIQPFYSTYFQPLITKSSPENFCLHRRTAYSQYMVIEENKEEKKLLCHLACDNIHLSKSSSQNEPASHYIPGQIGATVELTKEKSGFLSRLSDLLMPSTPPTFYTKLIHYSVSSNELHNILMHEQTHYRPYKIKIIPEPQPFRDLVNAVINATKKIFTLKNILIATTIGVLTIGLVVGIVYSGGALAPVIATSAPTLAPILGGLTASLWSAVGGTIGTAIGYGAALLGACVLCIPPLKIATPIILKKIKDALGACFTSKKDEDIIEQKTPPHTLPDQKRLRSGSTAKTVKRIGFNNKRDAEATLVTAPKTMDTYTLTSEAPIHTAATNQGTSTSSVKLATKSAVVNSRFQQYLNEATTADCGRGHGTLHRK